LHLAIVRQFDRKCLKLHAGLVVLVLKVQVHQ
jgi:hypothetical protein